MDKLTPTLEAAIFRSLANAIPHWQWAEDLRGIANRLEVNASRKPTIAELEAILARGDVPPATIDTDGAIKPREEAARREAETKPRTEGGAGFGNGPGYWVSEPKGPMELGQTADCAGLAPQGEREGLGSAAAYPPDPSGLPGAVTAPREVMEWQSAPFSLEVGKSYARRDGTGPVPITKNYVYNDRTLYSSDDNDYDETGKAIYGGPLKDLVSLWQAEAQAPNTLQPNTKIGPGVAPQTDDLVQRLREVARDYRSGRVDHTCSDAADQLEALKEMFLQAGKVSLERAERTKLWVDAKARVARLEDILNGLRCEAILLSVAVNEGDPQEEIALRVSDIRAIIERASAALAGETNG